MYPSVYFFDVTTRGYELYLGEYSTVEALALFDFDAGIEVTEFGSTNYANMGWTTVDDLPTFQSVRSVISFLQDNYDVGLVSFAATIEKRVELGTHDDGECHFIFHDLKTCNFVLTQVCRPEYRDLLISTLQKSPSQYITCNSDGTISKFASFDDYIRSTT